MIKLYDSKPTDVMPPLIAQDVYVRCLSYAIQKEQQRLLRLIEKTKVQTMVDDLDEQILDVLAVELRSMYYTQDMPINIKRNIIKNTLLWHKKAGTPNAVAELIRIAFNSKTGDVVEWFNFEKNEIFEDDIGEPGTFDIVTDRLTENAVDYFLSVIHKVKNTRSHLRYVRVYWEIESKEYIASGITSMPKHSMSNHLNYSIKKYAKHYGGAGAKSTVRQGIANTINTSIIQREKRRAAIGTVSVARIVVGNTVKLNRSVKVDYKHMLAQVIESNVSIVQKGV